MLATGELSRGLDRAAYLPHFLPAWAAAGSGVQHREVDGSLVMIDISGFTRLTERLAGKGRAGAEEMSEILDGVFTPLVTAAEHEGADLLKWGGDAVLVMLDGDRHAVRAARAAVGMQRELARVGHLSTSVGRIVLRATSGVYSGRLNLVLCGDEDIHRELIVLGPAASGVASLDHGAVGGQIVLNHRAARTMGSSLVGPRVGAGRLLTGMPRLTRAWSPGQVASHPADLIDSLLPPDLRRHLEQHTHEPEHRIVTASFIRFDDTDDLLEQKGADWLAQAVDELVRNVQDSVSRHGVTFHETDIDIKGGKFMLIAGAPLSTGDDSDHMLSAVRLIVDRAGEIPMRAGVAAGRVFTGHLGPRTRRTYSVIGGAVNLAARLAARAEPGTVVMPTELLAHTRRGYAVRSLPPMSLKGIAQPVAVAALEGATEELGPDTASALVGRRVELDLFRGQLALLADGIGGVIQVVGEPGIGKTRLMTEVLAAAADFRVITLAGDRSGIQAPYGAARHVVSVVLGLGDQSKAEQASMVREQVHAVAPELLTRLPLLGGVLDLDLTDGESAVAEMDEQYRSESLEQLVVELLAATLTSSTLLLLEDTQRYDPASAAVMTRIAQAAAERPWLVINTRRTGPGGWASESGQQVELGPLDADLSVDLAEGVNPDHPLPPSTIEALAQRSGGHPLFLRELVLAASRGDGLDDLPESVEELVAVQLDALSPQQRSLLRRAAVLGNAFTVPLLQEMLAEPDAEVVDGPNLEQALSELDSFVAPAGGGRMVFRHAVHREVAYAGLPFRTRSALHVRAAEALERTTDFATTRPELLGFHYFSGGRYEESWRYARQAGRRANDRFAPAAAAEEFARAADAAQRSRTVSPGERSMDLEDLGDALLLCGRPVKADDAFREALRADHAAAMRQASLMLKRAKVAHRVGRNSLALRWISLGLDGLVPESGIGAVAIRAQLISRRAVVLMSQGRYSQARTAADLAARQATEAGERGALAQSHLVLCGVMTFSGSAESRLHGSEALRLFEELGDLGGQARALNNLSMGAYMEGRWPEALDMYARAADMFRRTGNLSDEATALYNQAELLNRQGAYIATTPLLERVMRVARAVGDQELVALALREQGRALARSLELERGTELLDEARQAFEALGEPHEVCDTDISVAEAYVLSGNAQQGMALARAAILSAALLGAVTLLPAAHRVVATAAVNLGEFDTARSALDEGLRLSASPELAHERGFLLAVAAHLALLTEVAGESQDTGPAGTAAGTAGALQEEADSALGHLGVVRLPVPW